MTPEAPLGTQIECDCQMTGVERLQIGLRLHKLFCEVARNGIQLSDQTGNAKTSMAVPDFQSMMLPQLESLADGKPHSIREVADAVAKKLSVTNGERAERIPSGGQTKFANRIAWVGVHLSFAKSPSTPSVSSTSGIWLRDRPSRAARHVELFWVTAFTLRAFPPNQSSQGWVTVTV